MIGRKLLRFSPIALVLAAAACGGGGGTKTVTVTKTIVVTVPAPTTKVRIYLLHGHTVQPVLRAVLQSDFAAENTLDALQDGPSAQERALGLTTAVVPTSIGAVAETPAKLIVTAMPPPNRSALAQIVFTLEPVAGGRSIEINGKPYTQADFEDETPLIQVASPLPFAHVTSPLHATGTSDTFEATFNYDLVGPDGKLLAHHFVTATSGNGVRGTFDFTVPFTISQAGQGKLVVYELSAKDGSRIHQVEIPLTLQP